PARTAQWLWDRSSTSPVPVGRAYFRTVFATPSGYSRFKLYVAGADDVTLWLDGVPVITAEGLRTGKSETVELEIGPGFHIFAAEARNRGGPAGFLFTAQPIHTDGTLAAPWLSSDASYWRCIAYTTPARFTAGKILRVLLNEANARGNEEAGTSGTLLGWNLRFDDLVDSDGNPWPLIKNYSVSVGTDLLSVLHQLADEHIDFACSPSRRDLYAWRKGTRGGNVPVTFAPEVNITSLSSVAES
ncbi:MAG TPA: hypothetical protein VL179_10730, partial [Mycobacterium sp.]|nr:hypothetical protein [Mycobacterium sp.]